MSTVTIDGRLYKARNFRLTADRVKVADVYYYHPDRGWREVKRWERILEVAAALWPVAKGGAMSDETKNSQPEVENTL